MNKVEQDAAIKALENEIVSLQGNVLNTQEEFTENQLKIIACLEKKFWIIADKPQMARHLK